MTARERRLVYEVIAIALAGFGLLFAIPALMSAHDTVALLAVFFLVLGLVGWVAYYVYRIQKHINKETK
jgi:drug/metabolite transporter (DMT)-like permease